MQGVVKWFNSKKGYGFIEAQGQDYFCHISEVAGDTRLEKGDQVIFESAQTRKGVKAVKVRKKSEHTIIQTGGRR